jgi:hypothetical protein
MAMVVVVATLTIGIMVAKVDRQTVAIITFMVAVVQWDTVQITNTTEDVATGVADVEVITFINAVTMNQRH